MSILDRIKCATSPTLRAVEFGHMLLDGGGSRLPRNMMVTEAIRLSRNRTQGDAVVYLPVGLCSEFPLESSPRSP